jgi:hypothetical protein
MAHNHLQRREAHIDTVRQLLAAMLPVAMPTNMLRSIVMVAPPLVCLMVLDFQESAVTYRVEQLIEDHARLLRNLDPMMLTSRCVGGQQVSPLWQALLNNDHFFQASSSSGALTTIHSVLMRLLQVIPSGSVTQQSHAHCVQLRDIDWAALLNKTSRVYLNKKRGQELLAVHRVLLQKFAGISLRMPHNYILRVVGAVFDEALIKQELDGALVPTAWTDISELLRWAVPLVSQADRVQRALVAIGRKAAVQLVHSDSEQVVGATDDHVIAARLLELYEICAAHRIVSPASSEKDSFQQLTRYMSPALFDDVLRSTRRDAAGMGDASSHHADDIRMLDLWLSYIEKDASVKFSWILDAVLTFLRSIQEASVVAAGVPAAANRFALHLLSALETTLLPGRNAAGIRPRSVPNIRRVLEALGVVPPSPFWWTCGCGAANPACSTHCYSCMRRGRVAWKCGTCAAEHSSSTSLTRSKSEHCHACKTMHPRFAAAQRALQDVCSVCHAVYDPALGDCTACSGSGEGQGGEATNCQTCGHMMSLNSPLCPRCLSRNLLSDVKLWHCSTCRNYSYSTWSKCQRCAPHVTSVKAANALTVPFFTWKCGCGTVQHPCKLGCSTCTNSGTSGNDPSQQKFCCSQCHRTSHLRRSILQDYDSSTLRITLCEHCAFPHPRDHVLLTLPKAVPRPCVSCGRSYVAKQGNGLGPQVCGHCLSLQPINTNLPFLCASASCTPPATPQSPAMPSQWQWSNMECTTCRTLRSDAAVYCDPFVWKCLAPLTDSSDVVSDEDVDDHTDAHICNHWNPSWTSSCRQCRVPRRHAPEDEIRAKYIPWTCSVCHTSHPATAVLECPVCRQGQQPAPIEPCTSCGLHHIAWRCPTLDQLIEAERILCEMEDERARVRLGVEGMTDAW